MGLTERSFLERMELMGLTTKPMTNADKLRSMTDEELAKWLWFKTGQCPPFDRCPQPDRKTPCVMNDCWLDWLRQEARE